MSSSSGLPLGWVRAQLDEVFEPRSTRVAPGDFPESPYIGMEHVEGQTNRLIGTVKASTMSSSAAKFCAGDVLYGRMRPYLNKVVLPQFEGLASAEFIVFPTTTGIDNKFLLWRLSSSDFVKFACSQYEGDRPRVKFDRLGKFNLLLPPSTEQTRIVETLEELLSDLDAGVAELKAAQRKLAQCRRSLLKAAVEGTLTADWRDARTQTGEPQETGTELLQRILTERRARWEINQLARYAEQGKTPPKGWQAKYNEPETPESANLPSIPEGWTWASIEQIASDERYSLAIGPFGSNLKVSDYREEGVPLVFVRNIRSSNYGGGYTKYVTHAKAAELSAHGIQSGDVLITKMGEPPGDADVYPHDQPPAVITADCIKVRCESEMMQARFLAAVINSNLGKQQIKPITQGVAQKKVSLGRFSTLAVPLPGMEEQQEICSRLMDVSREIDSQSAAVEHSLNQSTAQRKNILKAAFAGQLVPQDSNDEPATVLLARIRAARNDREKQPKVTKKKQQKEIAAVVRKLIDVLAEAGDWVLAQEAFRRCGVVDGALTDQIEALYAELRALDKAGRLEIDVVVDEQGRKLSDRLKLAVG